MMLTGIGVMGFKLDVTQFAKTTCGFTLVDYVNRVTTTTCTYYMHVQSHE